MSTEEPGEELPFKGTEKIPGRNRQSSEKYHQRRQLRLSESNQKAASTLSEMNDRLDRANEILEQIGRTSRPASEERKEAERKDATAEIERMAEHAIQQLKEKELLVRRLQGVIKDQEERTERTEEQLVALSREAEEMKQGSLKDKEELNRRAKKIRELKEEQSKTQSKAGPGEGKAEKLAGNLQSQLEKSDAVVRELRSDNRKLLEENGSLRGKVDRLKQKAAATKRGDASDTVQPRSTQQGSSEVAQLRSQVQALMDQVTVMSKELDDERRTVKRLRNAADVAVKRSKSKVKDVTSRVGSTRAEQAEAKVEHLADLLQATALELSNITNLYNDEKKKCEALQQAVKEAVEEKQVLQREYEQSQRTRRDMRQRLALTHRASSAEPRPSNESNFVMARVRRVAALSGRGKTPDSIASTTKSLSPTGKIPQHSGIREAFKSLVDDARTSDRGGDNRSADGGRDASPAVPISDEEFQPAGYEEEGEDHRANEGRVVDRTSREARYNLTSREEAQNARLRAILSRTGATRVTPELVQSHVDKLGARLKDEGISLPITPIGECKYVMGNKRLTLTVSNDRLCVRVGGGFRDLLEHLKILRLL